MCVWLPVGATEVSRDVVWSSVDALSDVLPLSKSRLCVLSVARVLQSKTSGQVGSLCYLAGRPFIVGRHLRSGCMLYYCLL